MTKLFFSTFLLVLLPLRALFASATIPVESFKPGTSQDFHYELKSAGYRCSWFDSLKNEFKQSDMHNAYISVDYNLTVDNMSPCDTHPCYNKNIDMILTIHRVYMATPDCNTIHEVYNCEKMGVFPLRFSLSEFGFIQIKWDNYIQLSNLIGQIELQDSINAQNCRDNSSFIEINKRSFSLEDFLIYELLAMTIPFLDDDLADTLKNQQNSDSCTVSFHRKLPSQYYPEFETTQVDLEIDLNNPLRINFDKKTQFFLKRGEAVFTKEVSLHCIDL